MELQHLKLEVPENHLRDQSSVDIKLCIVAAEKDQAEGGDRDFNVLLIHDRVVPVLLLCLLLQAQELLGVRIIPDSQLELTLIPIDEVYVEVAALHEVGEDLLHHCHSDRLTLDTEGLGKV